MISYLKTFFCKPISFKVKSNKYFYYTNKYKFIFVAGKNTLGSWVENPNRAEGKQQQEMLRQTNNNKKCSDKQSKCLFY